MGSTSARQDLLNGIKLGLEASTAINNVTFNAENWWDWDITQFPGCTIIDERTDIDYLSYPTTSTSIADMEANMYLNIRGYAHDLNNVLTTKRAKLLKAIETAMIGSTHITSKCAQITPLAIQTDNGIPDNYSITNSRFKLTYFYNHLAP